MMAHDLAGRRGAMAWIAVALLALGSWFMFLISVTLALIVVPAVTGMAWAVLLPRGACRLRKGDKRYLRDLRFAAIAGIINLVIYGVFVGAQFRASNATSLHEYLYEFGQWSGDAEAYLFVISAVALLLGVVATTCLRKPEA